MNISTDTSYYLSMLTGLGSTESSATGEPLPPPPPRPDSDQNISAMGQWMSEISDDEKSELQTFLEQIRTDAASGSLDSEALAEQAPASLQALADEQGVDLTELITALANAPVPPQDKGMGPPPGPPPEELQSIMDFHQQVQDAVAQGSFDADSLAESAPEEVATLAAQQGVDLTELINWMAENEPPAKPTPPAEGAPSSTEVASKFEGGGDGVAELAGMLSRFIQS